MKYLILSKKFAAPTTFCDTKFGCARVLDGTREAIDLCLSPTTRKINVRRERRREEREREREREARKIGEERVILGSSWSSSPELLIEMGTWSLLLDSPVCPRSLCKIMIFN